MGFRIFFFPIQASCPLGCPAVLWRLIIKTRTFHVCFRVCFLASLCSEDFGHLCNSRYFTRLHYLLFPWYTDALIMARLWLDQCFSSQTECRHENEIQHEILRTKPWPPSRYQLSILGSLTLFPMQLCLVNLQSFSLFFLWWQSLRCDKCWSEKSQSSYLSVTRVPRQLSIKR